MTRNIVSTLAMLLALTTGCTPAAGNGGRGAAPAESAYPQSQSWALRDGTVTDSEYRTAIDALVSCVRTAGYRITDPTVSPVDGLTLLYDIEPAGDPDTWNTRVEACDTANVSMIEPSYVEQRPQVMDPALRKAVAACLRADGFTPTGTEHNIKDFVELTKGPGEPATHCVTATVPKVFPKAPKTLKIRW
jgi:hypothetical protein